jgi:DNA-binding NarL/FixJ family response regulator
MVRVLVVDDTRLFREGLARTIEASSDMIVAGVAADPEQVLIAIHDCRPDIVLLRMAVPESIGMLRAIADQAPQVSVIALGLIENDNDIIACAEAGVAGYLSREGSVEDLVATVRSVARGEALCSPRIAATLLRRVATLASERQSSTGRVHLTAREREIVRLIDEGLSNKEIAQRLYIEVRTVKNHVHNILEKLQVHNRGEAAALMRAGRPLRNGDRGPRPRGLDPATARD